MICGTCKDWIPPQNDGTCIKCVFFMDTEEVDELSE